MKGQYWNPSQFNEAEFDKKMAEVYAEPDERVRQVKAKLMTREILEKAPYIWLPAQYGFTAWWPWVKNYGGPEGTGLLQLTVPRTSPSDLSTVRAAVEFGVN